MSSILSVSQLNKYVAFKLKSDVKLKGICVKGEISNYNLNYKSGHIYFTIKDEQSCIKAVMFASSAVRLKTELKDGMSVLVVGNVEIYEAGGTYQIIATDITPLGSGASHDKTELIKEKLYKMGIFDEKNKKPIPAFPRKIAVVTSMTGAALQDILNVLQRRFPICTVGVFHTQVQGSESVETICAGLKKADNGEFDTIILARGGGALEELSSFNTEAAAMAVYDCKTPIISAVGHEINTSLVDYAADLRAPTPSAAAELATPDKSQLAGAVDNLSALMKKSVLSRLERFDSRVDRLFSEIKLCSPKNKLKNNERLVNDLSLRLKRSIARAVEKKEYAFESRAGKLNTLSPFNVLSRGYSIVQKNESVVMTADDIKDGDRISIRFRNDTACATVTEITRKEEE
ncbi:MAG: exodeoxyribonuclease VII large subunit [Ruminococcus sp.]|nr:exodeoxyribonuclease VII large subunit [Ruminococcus sp.]